MVDGQNISLSGRLLLVAGLATGLLVSGCSSSDDKSAGNAPAVENNQPSVAAHRSMWLAALQTVGFMPILQADDLKGVIETGWYIPPAAPAERMRVLVRFNDRTLRSTAVTVRVARQELSDSGQWLDVNVHPQVASNLEDTIIIKALAVEKASGRL